MCLQEGPGQLELVAVASLARGTAVSLVQVAVLVHRQPERSVHQIFFPLLADIFRTCGRCVWAGV